MIDKLQIDNREVDVSIIVPIYNEVDNVEPLYVELMEMISAQQQRYEVVFIDDGSSDDTLSKLRAVTAGDNRVNIVPLTKNFGQSAAMAAGFDYACGAVIVPMDGDLQNDPSDIPRLVARLNDGNDWDIVSGWRKQRQDKLLSRKFPSRLANLLIKRLTWTREIHDFGCTLKAYRREVLDDVHLYGEMHRFLPAICKWRGARVTEEAVNHRPRTAGKSKYGMRRTVKVMLDLLTVKFMGDYLTKPIYFFGKIAMATMMVALTSLSIAIAQKYGFLYWGEGQLNLNKNVLLLFAMMTFLMSIMFIMLGVLSDLLSRVYHESQGLKPYKVKVRRLPSARKNLDPASANREVFPASVQEQTQAGVSSDQNP